MKFKTLCPHCGKEMVILDVDVSEEIKQILESEELKERFFNMNVSQ